MKKNCIDCNIEFEITDGEKAFFEQRDFSLPKRCKPCRVKKKQQRHGGYNG